MSIMLNSYYWKADLDKVKALRLMTTSEESSLIGPETFMVVFSHEKEEDSVKK